MQLLMVYSESQNLKGSHIPSRPRKYRLISPEIEYLA